jgi:hypothetical protein
VTPPGTPPVSAPPRSRAAPADQQHHGDDESVTWRRRFRAEFGLPAHAAPVPAIAVVQIAPARLSCSPFGRPRGEGEERSDSEAARAEGADRARRLKGRPITNLAEHVDRDRRLHLPPRAAHLPRAGHRRGYTRRAAAEGAEAGRDAGTRATWMGGAAKRLGFSLERCTVWILTDRRAGPALLRARLHAMIPHLPFRVRRERCAGCRPLNTISTGARTQGGDALCSHGFASCGSGVSRRWREQKSCGSLPSRRRAPTNKPTAGAPKRPDPFCTDPGCARPRGHTPPRGSCCSTASRPDDVQIIERQPSVE